jgi:hypothetical protein
MRILNLSFDDWANYSHDNANALRSVGIQCVDLKRKPHSFGYESESKVVNHERILTEIRNADIVQLMHSYSDYLRYAVDQKKRVIVYHTGTAYRINPKNCNDIFNPYVEAVFTDQCEFMELGGKDIKYVATAIDTAKIEPLPWSTKDKTTFAHFPSNSQVKGTMEIIQMLLDVDPQESRMYFTHDTKTIPHREQIKRMSWCDVYIELFKPFLYGKQYGCYGVTAFEAAALGKIVMTNNMHEKVYTDAYGSTCALWITNTPEHFKRCIEKLINYSPERLADTMEFSRDWIVEKHSYKATGHYIKKLLNL